MRTALDHREPDRIPVDFGSTSVSGIHVSCVAALRDHYGLDPRPVKVHEPVQMLGLIDDDLRAAMGIDVDGVFPRKVKFGVPAANWKPWRCSTASTVLVPGDFRTRSEPNGDILVFPEGDESAAPSARMPKGSYFFDAIIRQPEIDEDKLDPADNLEEFGPISDADLDHLERAVAAASGTDRAVVANFGGTSFGDIALVPAVALKNPKGIRDVAEWYMSTRSRRGYIHRVFERQCEIALANLARIHARIGNPVDCVFVCGTDFGTQTSSFCSRTHLPRALVPLLQAGQRLGPRQHHVEDASSIPAARWSASSHRFIEAGFDILNPVQCSAAGMDPEQLKQQVRRAPRLLGRRRGHAEDAAVRHARRGARAGAASAARSSRPAAASSSTRFTTCRPARRWRISSPC